MSSEQRLQRQPDLPRALADGNEAVTATAFGCRRPDKAKAPKLSARSSRSHLSGLRERVMAWCDLREGKDAGSAIAAHVHTPSVQARRRQKERG
jgi:hypothetical protein